MSLNLSGTYMEQLGTRPPSCTTPGQPTIYVMNPYMFRYHILVKLFQIHSKSNIQLSFGFFSGEEPRGIYIFVYLPFFVKTQKIQGLEVLKFVLLHTCYSTVTCKVLCQGTVVLGVSRRLLTRRSWVQIPGSHHSFIESRF